MRWLKTITREQWKVLAAAQLGWMLDAMDVMLYAFALTAIREEFALSSAQSGAVQSITLLASAFGGVLFGILADRIGRARALIYSILTYSIFTGMTATAGSVAALLFWRALVGIGLGGEWSAGSVLVAESWPAEHRGKAIGFMQSGWAIGYMIAALISAPVLTHFGWRWLFAAGVLPALLTLWIRRNVPEPEIWRRTRREARTESLGVIFRPPLLRNTVVATLLATSLLIAYWGLFTWVPTYLSSPIERGGAGLTLFQSAAWILPMQTGAFLGYILFGILADRFGRRPVFLVFVLGAALLVPLYGTMGENESLLLALGPFLGFFGHGYFSVFGAMLAELFPSGVRGAAQGLCYNCGRAVSAFAPMGVGALADRSGIGTALAAVSVFYVVGAGLILLLPETRGGKLQ
ncbi:MAG: MFS transporter [Bryobacteraceae bacterium]